MRNLVRRWCSGHLLARRDPAARFLDPGDQGQRRLLPCLAPSRAHFALPWTQAFEPALTDSTIRALALVSNTAQVSSTVEVLLLVFVNLIGKKSKMEVPFGFRVFFVLFAANTDVVSFVLFFFHESKALSAI